MVQTSVEYDRAKGYPGMEASGINSQTRGAIEELISTNAGYIPWGSPLVDSSTADTPGGVDLPSAAGQTFKGILALNLQWGSTEESILTGEGQGLAPNSPASVATEGDRWVTVEGAVNAGDPVFYRHTAGAAPNDSATTFTNATSANHDAVPGARFMSSTTARGLAIVNLGGA